MLHQSLFNKYNDRGFISMGYDSHVLELWIGKCRALVDFLRDTHCIKLIMIAVSLHGPSIHFINPHFFFCISGASGSNLNCCICIFHVSSWTGSVVSAQEILQPQRGHFLHKVYLLYEFEICLRTWRKGWHFRSISNMIISRLFMNPVVELTSASIKLGQVEYFEGSFI